MTLKNMHINKLKLLHLKILLSILADFNSANVCIHTVVNAFKHNLQSYFFAKQCRS